MHLDYVTSPAVGVAGLVVVFLCLADLTRRAIVEFNVFSCHDGFEGVVE